jgi:hypothetical protein
VAVVLREAASSNILLNLTLERKPPPTQQSGPTFEFTGLARLYAQDPAE